MELQSESVISVSSMYAFSPSKPLAAETVSCLSSSNMNSACMSSSNTFCCRGKVTVKVLPTPGWLLTWMLPWCISTISFANDRPIPEEGCRMFCFTKDSKRWNNTRCLSGTMPIPSSFTSISTDSSFGITFMVIALPGDVYLNALDSRLKNIFSNLSLSTHP